MPKLTAIIDSSDRVAITVSKQILIPKGTIGRNCYNIRCIRADESPKLWAVVPAVEIVQPRLGVVIVPPVAERILIAYGVAGGVGDGAVAPGVVAVGGHNLSGGGADDGNNIPLDIVEVVEQHSPVGEAHALSGAVVDETHDAVAGFLRQNLAAVEEEFRCGAVDCFGRADAVGVVLIAVGVAAVGDFPQLTALPGVGGAVVGEHVAEVTDNAILCGEISATDNCVVFFYF